MKLTRRNFLVTSGALGAGVGLGALAGAAPAPRRRPRVLVVIFLRGGVDGLNLIAPYGEPAYYRLRDWMAVPPPGRDNGAIDLDGFFGLHPAAAALAPCFADGSAVALHGVGSPGNSRSHFEEQDAWETGILANTPGSDGWLNRHLQTTPGTGPIRALCVGGGLPRILRGDAKALAVRGLSELAPQGAASADGASPLTMALEQAYRSTGTMEKETARLLARTGRDTIEAMEELRAVLATPDNSAAYPETELARQLSDVARIVRSDVGLEIAEIDFGGFDTHQNQPGTFDALVKTLADALAAFLGDLGDRADDVLVLTLSEFGRTAAMNGTRGTDHGWANCMLALGQPVATASGGRPRDVIVNEWPGLEPEQLHQQRDLQDTTDFRDVLAEVVEHHLGNPRLDVVLPGHVAKPVGLL